MIQANNTLCDVFQDEFSLKRKCYVKWKETAVESSDAALVVDLATCVSVMLTGIDSNGQVWLGLNHLFKCRENDSDVSLEHISEIRDILVNDKKCIKTACLGVFGAGYKENSLSSKIAKNNIITSLESLSLFDYSVELFLTGYQQNISAFYSGLKESFFIKNTNIETKESNYYMISAEDIFKDAC